MLRLTIPFDFSSEISNMVCFSAPIKRGQQTARFKDLEADSLSRPFHYPRQCSSRICLRSMAAAEKVLTNAKDVFSRELICLPPREFLVDYWDMVVPCRVAMAQFWQRGVHLSPTVKPWKHHENSTKPTRTTFLFIQNFETTKG